MVFCESAVLSWIDFSFPVDLQKTHVSGSTGLFRLSLVGPKVVLCLPKSRPVGLASLVWWSGIHIIVHVKAPHILAFSLVFPLFHEFSESPHGKLI